MAMDLSSHYKELSKSAKKREGNLALDILVFLRVGLFRLIFPIAQKKVAPIEVDTWLEGCSRWGSCKEDYEGHRWGHWEETGSRLLCSYEEG